MTDAGARVVLADFGLATYLPNDSDILKERFACGTAGFLAPECKGRLAIFSAKSDMFLGTERLGDLERCPLV